MEVEECGGGVVAFHNVIDIDREFLADWIAKHRETEPPQFTDNGDGTYTNLGGYTIDAKQALSQPGRLVQIWDDDPEFAQTLSDALLECVKGYMYVYPAARQAVWARMPAHVVTYTEGQSIGEHTDTSVEVSDVKYWEGEIPKATISSLNVISGSLLLNDDFEGGEMRFRHAAKQPLMKAGSAVLYPSNYIGMHEVRPITKGERYSYLQFVGTGPLTPSEIETYKQWDREGKSVWLPPDILYERTPRRPYE